jgi:hypothetical protein
MKWVYAKYKFHLFAAALLVISCGQNSGQNNKKDSVKANIENAETTVPGIEKINFTDTILLKAGENMRFDNELFRVRAGKKIVLIFTNTVLNQLRL